MTAPWRSRMIPRNFSLIQAAQSNYTDMFCALLASGPVSDLSKGISFIYAMKRGNKEIAESTLQTNDWMISPFIYRCARHVVLQQKKSRNQFAIWWHMESIRFQPMERKWRSGASLLWNDRVRLAAHIPNFPEMDFFNLLQEGCRQGWLNIRTDTWTRDTGLMLMSKADKFRTWIPSMIQLGCNPAIQDDTENTALIWAIANANNEVAMTILSCEQSKACLNISGYKGNTALHLAIAKGYTDRSADGRPLTCSNLEIVKKKGRMRCGYLLSKS